MANKVQILAEQTLSDICRICLSSDGEQNSQVELYPIEDIYVEQCHLTDLITSFRDILTVFVNDEIETHGRTLPSMICLSCAKRAQDAYKFVEQCRRTDQLLESHFSIFKSTEKLQVPHDDQPLPREKESPRKSSVKLSERRSSAASNKIKQRSREGKSPQIRSDPTRKRFQCDKCDKSFTQSQTLRRHCRTHDKTGSNVKTCTFCSKTFLRSDDLTRHIRTHTGERPYQCNMCPKAYKQWSELNEHCLTHTATKLFKCSECSKELTSRNGLYVHMKVHRGEKRFTCAQCSKSFTTSSELTGHIRRIHPQQNTAIQSTEESS